MSSDIINKLKAPFDPALVSFRVGAMTQNKDKAMGLAYIDARDVMERLDHAVGAENWQRTYSHVGDRTCCDVSIRFGDTWVTKADGAGDTDVEGTKGAFSDAFKRAAVNWGIGRHLYDLPSPWVPVEPAGRSYKFTQDGLRLLRNTVKEQIRSFNIGLETDPTQAKKSSNKAKKDGDWEKFKTGMFSCENLDALIEWKDENKDELSKQPEAFKKELLEMYGQQKQRLQDLTPPGGFDGSSDV